MGEKRWPRPCNQPLHRVAWFGVGFVFEEQAELAGIDQIRDGGAALIAYARLMFEDLSPTSRARIEKSLLEYCELDTLAMIFLYQGLIHLISQ